MIPIRFFEDVAVEFEQLITRIFGRFAGVNIHELCLQDITLSLDFNKDSLFIDLIKIVSIFMISFIPLVPGHDARYYPLKIP